MLSSRVKVYNMNRPSDVFAMSYHVATIGGLKNKENIFDIESKSLCVFLFLLFFLGVGLWSNVMHTRVSLYSPYKKRQREGRMKAKNTRGQLQSQS